MKRSDKYDIRIAAPLNLERAAYAFAGIAAERDGREIAECRVKITGGAGRGTTKCDRRLS